MDYELLDCVVLSVAKRVETNVSSSGGHGFVYNGTGYIPPVEISSDSVTVTELWVKLASGQEMDLTLPRDLSIRESQVLTFLVVGSKFVSIRNHNTGEEIPVHGSHRDLIRSYLGDSPGSCLLTLVVLFFILLGLAFWGTGAEVLRGLLPDGLWLELVESFPDLVNGVLMGVFGVVIPVMLGICRPKTTRQLRYDKARAELERLLGEGRKALHGHDPKLLSGGESTPPPVPGSTDEAGSVSRYATRSEIRASLERGIDMVRQMLLAGAAGDEDYMHYVTRRLHGVEPGEEVVDFYVNQGTRIDRLGELVEAGYDMTLELLQGDNTREDRPSAGDGERASRNEVAACLENAFRHAAKEYRDTRGFKVDEGRLIRFTLPGCVPDGMVDEMYRIGMTRADLARQRQNLQTKCLDMIARVIES